MPDIQRSKELLGVLAGNCEQVFNCCEDSIGISTFVTNKVEEFLGNINNDSNKTNFVGFLKQHNQFLEGNVLNLENLKKNINDC